MILFYCSIVEYGPFKEQVLEFWNLRNEENILFLIYEEMLEDLKSIIKRTSSFLNKPISEQQLLGMEEFLTFDTMKENNEKIFTALITTANQDFRYQKPLLF